MCTILCLVIIIARDHRQVTFTLWKSSRYPQAKCLKPKVPSRNNASSIALCKSTYSDQIPAAGRDRDVALRSRGGLMSADEPPDAAGPRSIDSHDTFFSLPPLFARTPILARVGQKGESRRCGRIKGTKMEKSELAECLRARQRAKGKIPVAVIDAASDDRIIDSYITCHHCKEKQISPEKLDLAIVLAFSTEHFFSLCQRMGSHLH